MVLGSCVHVFNGFSLGRVVLYSVFMVVPLQKTLVKTLAKNLVKNLAKNLIKFLNKISNKNKKVVVSKGRECMDEMKDEHKQIWVVQGTH